VLILSNGTTCISLHHDFEKKLRDLYMSIDKSNRLTWRFFRSCCCDEASEEPISLACNPLHWKQENARYYNRRGRFFLRRGALLRDGDCAEVAWKYLNEAWRLDHENKSYQDDYEMALIAVRQERRDPVLDQMVATRPDLSRIPSSGDEGYWFRMEYMNRVEMTGRLPWLEARLNAVRGRPAWDASRLVIPPEWSFDDSEEGPGDPKDMFELGNSRQVRGFELEGSSPVELRRPS
jgi:hypothetical protein